MRENSEPVRRAAEILADPRGMLRKYAGFLPEVKDKRIAVVCGSCGKKAVPLAVLGARVVVFDLSEDNRRYACETAEAAGAPWIISSAT